MAWVHPIFSVLIRRPELVVDHLSGYAALAKQEASSLGLDVARCVLAWAIAVVSFIVFLMLAGVAAMLGVMHDEFHWILIVAPGVALALGAVATSMALKSTPSKIFVELRGQVEADAQALRMAGGNS